MTSSAMSDSTIKVRDCMDVTNRLLLQDSAHS
jgi:hypothetical protein